MRTRKRNAPEPHAFGGVHQAALAVNTSIYATIHRVGAMFEPERQYVGGEFGAVAFTPHREIVAYGVFVGKHR